MAAPKTIKILDYIIFSFVVLFLASLTTSIFVNQLGYYGALIFLLVKYILTKKNPFEKTGLEIPILLFISAEIFSTIFSLNQPQAFQNLLKRVLLLPIIYTIVASTNDLKKGKMFFKTYIGFALISCAIYIYKSYDYWIYNQFAVKESGPSVFHFPITAGELISFTIIFLFAFIINEKGNLKYRLFNVAAFAVASLALISTYKRTGWIGTAAGILAVLILKKQWKIIGAGAAAVILLFVFEKNVNDYSIYSFTGGIVKDVKTIETEGHPFDVTFIDGFSFISDYDNGLLVFDDHKFIKKIEIAGAVNKFEKWVGNYFIANLADSRFLLFKKNSSLEFELVDEFISPGFVHSFEIKNNYLYVNDSDSGLTVFRNPEILKDTLRFPQLNKNERIRFTESELFCYSNETGIKIYRLENGIPYKEIFSHPVLKNAATVDFIENKIFVSRETGYEVYNFAQNKLEKIDSGNSLKQIYLIQKTGNKYYLSGLDKKIFAVEIDSLGKLNILLETSTTELTSSFASAGEKLYTTSVREGRLKSIFDPNKPSNFVRFALWRAGWLIFNDYPLFGVGDIDLAFLYKQYKRNYDKEIQGHLHNNYVHLLAILGGFGFIVVMFLLSKIFFMNLKIYSELKEIPFLSSYSLGVVGALVSFLVAGLTEWNFGDHEIITMVWFVVGLNIAFYKLAKTNSK